MIKQTVGIAITTRNRPQVLDVCLKHFQVFRASGENVTMLILDDNSDADVAANNAEICRQHGFANSYVYSVERMGIAKAKNQCLHMLGNQEYYFLFDDDCFPKKTGWDKLYIDTFNASHCHHLLYNAHIGPYAPVGKACGVEEFNAELGVLLFMTKHCIDTIGGLDERYGIYGYEHMEYARRAQEAKMTNKLGRSCVPVGASDYIYSFDIDWQMSKIPPPLKNLEGNFQGSVADEPLEAYRVHSRRANGQINEEVSRGERALYMPLSGQKSLDFV